MYVTYPVWSPFVTTEREEMEREQEKTRKLMDECSPAECIALGDKALQASKYNDANDFYTRAVERDSNNAQTYLKRGRFNTYNWIGADKDRAIADFAQAINIDPNMVDAYLFRGETYLKSDEYDKALSDFDQAIKLDKNKENAYLFRAMVFKKLNEHDKEISDINRVININPANAQAFLARANLYFNMNKWNEAIADYDKVIEIQPKPYFWIDEIAFYWKAKSYYHLGNKIQAAEAAKKSCEVVPRVSRECDLLEQINKGQINE